MMRTAAPLLLLVLLAGCTVPETAPTMMYHHSALQQRPLQPMARPYYHAQEPLRLANGRPAEPVRSSTPYAPTQLPPVPVRTVQVEPPAAIRQPLTLVSHKEMPEDACPVQPTASQRPRRLPVAVEDAAEETPEVDAGSRHQRKALTLVNAPALDRLPQFPNRDHDPDGKHASPRLVNSRRIQLSYEVSDGVDARVPCVDVWYTLDRGRWQRYGSAPRSSSPYIVEVPGEGVYGFQMLARAENGTETAPRPHDRPQISVEVDVTRPEVSILSAKVESEGAARTVDVRWWASDKNLREGAICVSYARTATGPWHPVVSGMKADGQYVWKVPATVPHVVYLMVEAEDWAGNVGGAVTAKPIYFEAPRPPVMIKAVQPVASGNAQFGPVLGVQFDQ